MWRRRSESGVGQTQLSQNDHQSAPEGPRERASEPVMNRRLEESAGGGEVSPDLKPQGRKRGWQPGRPDPATDSEPERTVQVKLELGHRAQLREKPTSEGFTHDWMVFVRGAEQLEIQHFVERVVFRLHQSFPNPKRVCKEPPYKVEESGYAGFIMPIEVYFKNKGEPKRICFTYDVSLNLDGNPPVDHLRCETLTFTNPTKEFRRKLIKAGGTGLQLSKRPSPNFPMLPTIPLSAFSDPKKTKPSHESK